MCRALWLVECRVCSPKGSMSLYGILDQTAQSSYYCETVEPKVGHRFRLGAFSFSLHGCFYSSWYALFLQVGGPFSPLKGFGVELILKRTIRLFP